jgi:hypothetical protein
MVQSFVPIVVDILSAASVCEGGDRRDLMGGSPAGLYSSEEGKEHNSVWHSSESDIDTGRFKRRATTLNLVTTLKVLLISSRATCHVNYLHSNAALSEAPQAGESCAVSSCFVIKVSRED